jgi:hypothetical protein
MFLPILLRGVSGCKASLEAVYSSEARGGLRLDQRTNHDPHPVLILLVGLALKKPFANEHKEVMAI